jgi:hypothetical protein
MHPTQPYQPAIGKHRGEVQQDLGTSCAGSGAASGFRSGTDQVVESRERLIKGARRQLAETYEALVAAGVSSDAARISLLVLELSLTQLEQAEAHHLRVDPVRYSETVHDQVISDMPGWDQFPDPVTAQTPADFVQILQRYRAWAGNPSYRVMERLCDRRFAASTIHTALHGENLPSLDMVQAIIKGCRGSDAHMVLFTSAWRRFGMPQQVSGKPNQSPALRAV